MINIGSRLKYFRQRAGLSQMDLELATQCAFGSISRFESNKVKPTRETLEYIAQALKLNEIEVNYLLGSYAYPPTLDEITQAKAVVAEQMNTKGFIGYLIDERWRVHAYSPALARLLNISKSQEQAMSQKWLGKTYIEILLDPDLKIESLWSEEEANHNLKLTLSWYFQEAAFMVDDPFFQRSLELIESNPQANEIWKELKKEKSNMILPLVKARKYFLNISGIKVKVNFTNLPLFNYPRFQLVEITPENRLLKVLQKNLLG